MPPEKEKKYKNILIIVLMAIILVLVYLVVDLDSKSKNIVSIKVPEEVEVDKREELENKINQYIDKMTTTELENKYNIKRKVELTLINDNTYEVYVYYYQNGKKKLDFKSYFGEGTSSSLNTDNSNSALSLYLAKDSFSLVVFNDIKEEDEYYLIGNGNSYYIYDTSFNSLF